MNTFLGVRNAPLDKAKFVILPVPYDVTTSYIKGTARGPAAILKASAQVETFDEELEQDTAQKTSIYTLPTPPLDFRAKADKFIPALKNSMKTLVRKLSPHQTLITLGGEHSISYPLVSTYQSIYKDLSVLHLDAHSDLRDSYGGTKHSHACVMKRIYDSGIKSIVQVGIRNLTADCLKLLNSRIPHPVSRIYTYLAHTHPDYKVLGKKILSTLTDKVYVTIDLDVFDPSVMPAVGTPEPGGLNWHQALDILRPVFQKKNVVGFDVVELCPIKGQIASDFTAAKLIYRLMGYR
ncbi:MAG: agmatinase [Planctomycetota bacterium]